jgi:ribonuclease I
MGLPWVRLDGDIHTHDKTLAALNQRGGKGAMAVYMFALSWSGSHATDGHIPTTALRMLHGTPADARLLVDVGLWEPNGDGWNIHNYALRQQLTIVTELKRKAQRLGALRANCIRWHGPDCNCWQASVD